MAISGGGFLLTRSASTPSPTSEKIQTPQIPKTDTTEPNNSAEVQNKILAGKSSPLFDFTKAEYDKALRSNKLVVLYFYANWCPICKEEIPKFYEAFNELETDQVIGFRVNFNDSDTDEDETNLAREFGVAYQHTKVFLKAGERFLKSPETWEKERYLDEINKQITLINLISN